MRLWAQGPPPHPPPNVTSVKCPPGGKSAVGAGGRRVRESSRANSAFLLTVKLGVSRTKRRSVIFAPTAAGCVLLPDPSRRGRGGRAEAGVGADRTEAREAVLDRIRRQAVGFGVMRLLIFFWSLARARRNPPCDR